MKSNMAPKRKLHKSNKDYCKRYREKSPEKYRGNDAERKQFQRIVTKALNPALHEELKRKNREPMRFFRALKNQPKPVEPEEPPASYFSAKQSRYHSLKQAVDNLPKGPNKKMEVIGSLAKKYRIRIALSKRKERKYEDLSEEQNDWLKEFMDRSDMTFY